MAVYERAGESNEWHTPTHVFDALGVGFDLDVAAPVDRTHVCVPALHFITENSLETCWHGFVWMNLPFGHQSTKRAWLSKFFNHGRGIALTPDVRRVRLRFRPCVVPPRAASASSRPRKGSPHDPPRRSRGAGAGHAL